MGIFFCIAAFLITFMASRRSIVAGLGSLTAIGYFYGILRANYPQAASHFIFDSAVLAFYAVRLFQQPGPEARRRARAILPWLVLIVIWPVILVFLPLQDPLVQLVGLRGAIFLLPFLLFGARLTRDELSRLALPVAALNLTAFGFTIAEYYLGLASFFPHNSNTEIIYRSADVAGGQFRIPSIFTGSHAYAGTMVMTLPLLIGAWSEPGISAARRFFLLIAIAATVLGVFAAASRMHTVVLGLVILAALFSGRIKVQMRAAILAFAAVIAVIVLSNVRLQRVSTLSDTQYVSQRVGGSVNTGFFELLLEYPFGNGLGGGGTSLPYFLENRVRNHVIMENEYARIVLEQTVIGLCIWLAFIGWFISRRFAALSKTWNVTEELSWVVVVAYFGTGLLGIGLLTAIPQSMFMLLSAGAATSWKPEQLLFYTPDESETPAELAAT